MEQGLQISEAAARRINKVVQDEKNPALMVRLEVLGGGCSVCSPFHPNAAYKPDASKLPPDPLSPYQAHLSEFGIDKAMFVQPEPYGDDHTLVLDCLARTSPDQFKGTSPKVGVDWQMTPDIFNYASWTKGFKSGGVNPVPPNAPATPAAPAARMAERRVTNRPVPEWSSRVPDMVTSTCSWASEIRSTKRAKRLPVPHNMMVEPSFRTLPQSYTLAANVSISA